MSAFIFVYYKLALFFWWLIPIPVLLNILLLRLLGLWHLMNQMHKILFCTIFPISWYQLFLVGKTLSNIYPTFNKDNVDLIGLGFMLYVNLGILPIIILRRTTYIRIRKVQSESNGISLDANPSPISSTIRLIIINILLCILVFLLSMDLVIIVLAAAFFGYQLWELAGQVTKKS